MMQAIHAEAAVLCPREISARQLLCTVLDMLEASLLPLRMFTHAQKSEHVA